jgi:hypothetical protein
MESSYQLQFRPCGECDGLDKGLTDGFRRFQLGRAMLINCTLSGIFEKLRLGPGYCGPRVPPT